MDRKKAIEIVKIGKQNKITRFVDETKIEKKNNEALRIIRAIKGMFG